jgi:hypothetical protein
MKGTAGLGAFLSALGIVMHALLATACTRRGGGPHLQLVTPSAATPDFGDAPSRSSESLQRGGGAGGGGGAARAETNGNAGARGNALGAIIGGAIGVGAAAAAVGAGAIRCQPSTDSPSSGASVNVCSGERTPGPQPP